MCLPMSPFLIHHAYFLNRFKICKSIAAHILTTHLRLFVCITNNQSALLFTLLWLAIGHQRSTKVQQRQFFFFYQSKSRWLWISVQLQIGWLKTCCVTLPFQRWFLLIKATKIYCYHMFVVKELELVDSKGSTTPLKKGTDYIIMLKP